VNSTPGLDYAWARPTVATIKSTGAQWVGRYLSGDTTKNLTAAEYQRLTGAGLPVVAVWETGANRAGAGYSAGIADAKAALALANTIGLGPDSIIHFAVDYDALWGQVFGYFNGASIVLGQHRVGVYGGVNVITSAANAGYTYLWQTRATIRQTGGNLLSGDADADQAMTPDYGQHPRPAGDTVTPAEIETIADRVVVKLLAAQVSCPGDTPPTRSVAAILGYQDYHYSNIMNNIDTLKQPKQ
jgi:hypothetical protein